MIFGIAAEVSISINPHLSLPRGNAINSINTINAINGFNPDDTPQLAAA
jgi:hypothetical protein